MRYLVYILIAVNLGVFAWHAYVSPAREPMVAKPGPVPPGIDALVLLSERPGRTPPTAAPEPETETDGPGSVVATDEAQAPQDGAPVTGTPGEPEVTAAAAQQRVCRTVGPFMEKQDAISVFGALTGQGYLVKSRDGDVREPAGYWVYLPAMPARDARRIVADLDANGMKDYFIGKQNHVSLGIFSDREKALTRQQTVRSLGYDAVLDQRYRLRDVFWLDVEEQDQPLLGAEVWRAVQAQHTDIRAQRVSCE